MLQSYVMKKTLLLLLLHLFLVTTALAQLVAGPMLGHTDMREARIWLQTEKAASVTLEYKKQGNTNLWQKTETLKSRPSEAHCLTFTIALLEPGTTYEYRVLADGKAVARPYPLLFSTQPLWQWRNDPPAFKVAMGSCNFINETVYDRPGKPYGGDYFIFERMAEAKPDMMLWLGDNTYLREADWSSRAGVLHRYSHSRAIPEMQQMLAVCPNYAIWDDHDYGPNDANKSWVHKNYSLEAFKLFWANPTVGTPEVPGITTAFRFRDVDFFLLDDRWSRSSESLHDSCEREMLGEAQIEWLINALKFSDAPYKIVANGSQVLNSMAVYENYAVFACEREKLLRRIAAEGIKNVVFVTGDRHHSEISRLTVEGIVFHDVTASPLTSSFARSRDNEPNANRIEGSLVLQRNFALFEFSGPRKERELLIRFVDNTGKEVYQYKLTRQH